MWFCCGKLCVESFFSACVSHVTTWLVQTGPRFYRWHHNSAQIPTSVWPSGRDRWVVFCASQSTSHHFLEPLFNYCSLCPQWPRSPTKLPHFVMWHSFHLCSASQHRSRSAGECHWKLMYPAYWPAFYLVLCIPHCQGADHGSEFSGGPHGAAFNTATQQNHRGAAHFKHHPCFLLVYLHCFELYSSLLPEFSFLPVFIHSFPYPGSVCPLSSPSWLLPPPVPRCASPSPP